MTATGDPPARRSLPRRRRDSKRSSETAAPRAAPSVQTPVSGDAFAKLTLQRDQAARSAAAAAADLADKRTALDGRAPRRDHGEDERRSRGPTAPQRPEVALTQLQSAGTNGAATPQQGDANLQRRIAGLNDAIAARQEAAKHSSRFRRSRTEAGAAAAAVAGESNELVQYEDGVAAAPERAPRARQEHEDLQHRLDRARLSASETASSGGDQMTVIDPAYKPMRPSKVRRTREPRWPEGLWPCCSPSLTLSPACS